MMNELLMNTKHYYLMTTKTGYVIKSLHENYVKGYYKTIEQANRALDRAERDRYIDACEQMECQRVGG